MEAETNQLDQEPRERMPFWAVALLIFFFGSVGLMVAGCGGLIWWAWQPIELTSQVDPFELQSVSIPPMPDRGEGESLEDGVMLYRMSWGEESGGFYETPGQGGQLWLYLPSGRHEPKSLPCVLIAPAGPGEGSGMLLVDKDQPEHIPYVKAGYAVVSYEIDGPFVDDKSKRSERDSYDAFRDARAGLVNARNAMEYILNQVTEVDPDRIYAAGHSSAGDLALLHSAHDSRVAGCIAYMPPYDLYKRYYPVPLRLWAMNSPEAQKFINQSMPCNHIDSMTCPVFLFHSDDDQYVTPEVIRNAAREMDDAGIEVHHENSTEGGHYYGMLDHGIALGIEWLNRLDSTKQK